jgi:hypothetical protein
MVAGIRLDRADLAAVVAAVAPFEQDTIRLWMLADPPAMELWCMLAPVLTCVLLPCCSVQSNGNAPPLITCCTAAMQALGTSAPDADSLVVTGTSLDCADLAAVDITV